MKPAINTKSTPYNIPSNYFGSMQQKVMTKIGNTPAGYETLDLEYLSQSQPQSLPSDYFGSMQQSVLSSLHQSATDTPDLISSESLQVPPKYFKEPPAVPSKTKSIRLYSPWRTFYNIAATFLVLIGIGLLYIKPLQQSQSQKLALQTVNESDWQSFLDQEGDMEYEGNDPVVNLEMISESEVKQFLKEEEEYLDIL